MALKPCEECGKEISTDAKMCPHCGKEKPKEYGCAVFIIAITAFITVVLLIIVAAIEPPHTPTDPERIPNRENISKFLANCHKDYDMAVCMGNASIRFNRSKNDLIYIMAGEKR